MSEEFTVAVVAVFAIFLLVVRVGRTLLGAAVIDAVYIVMMSVTLRVVTRVILVRCWLGLLDLLPSCRWKVTLRRLTNMTLMMLIWRCWGMIRHSRRCRSITVVFPSLPCACCM